MANFKKIRVALVHDFLMQIGGAEKLLQSLVEIFPQAEVFTMVAEDKIIQEVVPRQKVHLSFLQNMPFCPQKYKFYLGLMPKATESFDLKDFDLVISITSAFVKGVLTDHKNTLHICYLNTPTRYLHGETDFYLKTSVPALVRPIVKLMLSKLRRWDLKTSRRPDYMIANSQTIAARMLKYYHRRADGIIFPFVDTEHFKLGGKKGNYFLLTGRLVPYKRYDIVIEAFNELGLPLKVAGSGYDAGNLKKLNINPKTEFLGRVSDAQLVKLYQDCRGYIFPALEDFGIVPLEAMACGKPVIAYGRGGSLETVVAGQTGIFFQQQNKAAVVEAIRRFQRLENKFDPQLIRKHALKFSKNKFIKNIETFIKEKYEHFIPSHPLPR